MGSIQDEIFKEMEKRHFSQAELSRRSGVSKSSLSRYLGGDDIPASKLKAIVDALEMSADELMGIDNISVSAQDEKELLSLYRSMSAHGREQLMVYARGCAATYPKNTAVEMGA